MTLILCCCAAADSPKKETAPCFESKITLTTAGKSYEGTLIRVNSDSLSLTVMSEQLDSPLKFAISEGGFSFMSGEREYKVALENAPASAAIVEVKNALDSLPLGEESREKGEIIIKSPLGSLRKKEKNGDFLSLSTPNCEVIFESFSVLQNQSVLAK
ncbi:MAG: hypothetical protein J6C75_07510 [Oscillospiraceae bacterium]|nr:hypothetical protein [Oscillospiraceae bacterium]MBP1578312.1 hypothetical protein [Oscillospiraceae bacterium]